MSEKLLIWTEGKTDRQHFRHAFALLGEDFDLEFKELESDFGDDNLLKQCIAGAREPHIIPNVFIFDRDRPDVVAKVKGDDAPFQKWGNNVYSFALPVPLTRSENDGISIELYYDDEVLATADPAGRRLFFAHEFNPVTCRHKTVTSLTCPSKNKLVSDPRRQKRIIDCEVYNDAGVNVALSKAAFATLVTSPGSPVDEGKAAGFREILAVLQAILDDSQPHWSPYTQHLSKFLESIEQEPSNLRLSRALGTAIQMTRLACTLYAASIIRSYDSRIRSDDPSDRKKVKPIRALLLHSSLQPTLSTMHKLASACQHILDASASTDLLALRSMMTAVHPLEELGALFDFLDQIFPSPKGHGRTVEKNRQRKPFFDFVVPELAKHETHVSSLARDSSLAVTTDALDFEVIKDALSILQRMLSPLEQLTLRHRMMSSVRNSSGEFTCIVTTFNDGRVSHSEETVDANDVQSGQLELLELLATNENALTALDLGPFLLLDKSDLYYFARKTVAGYEYVAPFGTAHIEVLTKRRFDLDALRSPSSKESQSLFWAYVEPTVNAYGTRANIPYQEAIVGRKQQINDIIQDILLIPNRDGIIYGQGGVGKTALLIQLTKQLFEEPDQEPDLNYDNIIWISAKQDYYNAVLDVVDTAPQKVTSFDNVLGAILEFCEMEDCSSYPIEGKQWLMGEIFREQKSLIVLDNFETIPAGEQREIINFFGTELKRQLRDKPDHCKILVTSRESIPSGFHQVSLRGLDLDESKELMQRTYQPYVHSQHPTLTDEQQSALYDATKGIPLLIKHAFGKIYEQSYHLDAVIRDFYRAGNKAIEFSFSEVLAFLKKDPVQLRILLLLELMARPLLVRHITDILGIAESDARERLARLTSYHCVFRIAVGRDEKFAVTDEAHAFSRRMVYDNAEVAHEVRALMDRLSIDQRMDYSAEEYAVSLEFQRYVGRKQLLAAEELIKEALIVRPESLLLNLVYAKYLKAHKGRVQEAIDRLEGIRTRSGNAREILRLLMKYYSDLIPPNYEQANVYANELEDAAATDFGVMFDLAELYLRWSVYLRKGFDIDILAMNVRVQKYKELAKSALRLLDRAGGINTHGKYYLLAQAHFNLWDYDAASKAITAAMSRLPKDSPDRELYNYWQNEIRKKKATYGSDR